MALTPQPAKLTAAAPARAMRVKTLIRSVTFYHPQWPPARKVGASPSTPI
jgi:hypothetical protein